MCAASHPCTRTHRYNRGRCRAADSATGTQPGRPPCADPSVGRCGQSQLRTRRPSRAAACHPAACCTRTPAHTLTHAHASTSPRTSAAASSNAYMRTPSRLHAHTRTPPTAAAGDACKGASQANLLHPPFSVNPRSRTRCHVSASATRGPPRTRPTAPLGRRPHISCAHGSRAKVPRPHASPR